MNPIRKIAMIALTGSAIAAFIPLADAGPIDIQLNVGAPVAYYPPTVVARPPLMVWLGNLGVYAAYGSNQPIFYSGSTYYYYYGNRWWAGPAYRGPWHPVPAPPPGLRRWGPQDWRHIQERAGQYAHNPHWRHFRPQARPQPPVPMAYRQHGPQRGPGPQGAYGPPHGPGHPPQGRPGNNDYPQHPGHGADHGHQPHGHPDHGQGHGHQPWQQGPQ